MFDIKNAAIALWHKEVIKFVIFFLIACILCFLALAPNLEAKLWIVDDHGVISWLPSMSTENSIGIERIFSDVGTRYRPIYLLFRYIESNLWGANASLWYLARILIAAFSIAICSLILLRYCKPILAFVFSAFIFLRWYWHDVYCRLGPAEIYAMAGMTLFCFAFQRIVENSAPKDTQEGSLEIWQKANLARYIKSSLLLLFSFILTIGSKENFIFLSLVPLFILPFYFRKRDYFHGSIFFLLLIISIYVAFNIFRSVQGGQDVYARSTNFMDRLFLLGGIFSYDGILSLWKYAALFFVALYLIFILPGFVNFSRLKIYQKSLKNMACISALLLIVYSSQYIIYNGEYPSGFARYNIPGMFTMEFFSLAALINFLALLPPVLKKKLSPCILALALILLSFGLYRNANVLHGYASENKKRTQGFAVFIDSIVKTLRQNPKLLLVFENRYPLSLEGEPIHSTKKFLAYKLSYDPEYAIRRDLYRPSSESKLEKMLNAGFGKEAAQRHSLIKQYARECISIFFSYEYMDSYPKSKATNCRFQYEYKI